MTCQIVTNQLRKDRVSSVGDDRKEHDTQLRELCFMRVHEVHQTSLPASP